MHGTEDETPQQPPHPLAGQPPADEALPDERQGDEDQHDETAASQAALALDEDERLPWLESDEDEDEDAGVDTARLIRFVLFGVMLLAAIVGALWLFSHRGGDGAQVADGAVIKAPAEPYKQAPKNPGGKTFAGTGDSAFGVSEGKSTPANLGGAGASLPAVTESGAAAPAAAGGIGVQVGAYSSQTAAEAGWSRLVASHEALKGLPHRVIEGSADIGTVYRLQAVAGDLAAANSLCAGLKAANVACQVKR